MYSNVGLSLNAFREVKLGFPNGRRDVRVINLPPYKQMDIGAIIILRGNDCVICELFRNQDTLFYEH